MNELKHKVGEVVRLHYWRKPIYEFVGEIIEIRKQNSESSTLNPYLVKITSINPSNRIVCGECCVSNDKEIVEVLNSLSLDETRPDEYTRRLDPDL